MFNISGYIGQHAYLLCEPQNENTLHIRSAQIFGGRGYASVVLLECGSLCACQF